MRLIYSLLLFRLFLTPALSQPNVIIIFTDDLGYADVGCFGGEIPAPSLDQLAASGVKMTHFYSAQPVCSAARAALLTGCYPNRIGIHQALMPGSGKGLNPQEVTVADMLGDRGYRTGIFGKWHLGDAPECMPVRQYPGPGEISHHLCQLSARPLFSVPAFHCQGLSGPSTVLR